MNRRTFLKVIGVGTVAAGGVGAVLSRGGPASALNRRLVVVELTGGNDNLATVVPYGDPAYYDLRSRTALDPASVLPLDDAVGLHPALARLHARGLAVVQGVGVLRPDLSHFEMMARWWAGDAEGDARSETGFLGRLCDAVGAPDAPAVGVSIGGGPSPALNAAARNTLSLADADGAWYLTDDVTDDPLLAAFRAGLAAMSHPDRAEAGALAQARAGQRAALGFGDLLRDLPEPGDYPDSDLGGQLSLVGRLLTVDGGPRVVHVPMAGDFDVHEGAPDRQYDLLEELDAGLDAFLNDLDHRGLADSVAVMTTSEFGRTPDDNDSYGTDHGTASVALLLGPVTSGLYGEQPSLRRLDADRNLRPTVSLDEYYATVAEGWMGVPASEVLLAPAAPLPGIFA